MIKNSFEINSTAELSEKDIMKIMSNDNISKITICDEKHYPHKQSYKPETLWLIKRKINEFLKNCPDKDPNNANSEKLIFSYIYTKLALLVSYDDFSRSAIFSDDPFFRMSASDIVVSSAGLESVFIENTALCSGFSESLRNLLAEKGIACKYITGKQNKNGTKDSLSHAWNQVFLDGKWYNCDLTWDYRHIRDGSQAHYFLKSDKDFAHDKKFVINKNFASVANNSVSDEEQQALLSWAKNRIQEEKISLKEQKNSKTFFKSILKFFKHTESEPEPEK